MNKTKILVVEDETIVSFDIECALESLGYGVTSCVINFDEALQSVKENTPDIILMDIRLENSKDGIDTAIAIQKIKNIPIIYLTAFSDEETIQRAIQTEPVGYLTKPFKREDLKTTITLGLHKINKNDKLLTNKLYNHLGNNYYYDINSYNLFYKDIPIKLSTKEQSLLSILIDAKGNIVSFEDLEHYIWPEKTVANSTFRALVYRLRSKMEHTFIQTVPNFGCKLLIS